jgi:uncharacterized protein (TIGR02271 family)
MSQTVIGIFESTNAAQEAKAYLVANGFNNENVDINASGAAGYTNNGEGDTSDRIGGFFSNLFSSNDDADAYTTAGRNGTIVTVHAQNTTQAEQAVQILDNYGAVDVNEYAERSRNAASGYTATDTESTGKVQVIEENLQVGKREVETGGVRLRSRIVERPVEESIRLREEHVTVERTPVSRPATEADFAAFKEGTVEVTEHAERAVVAKEARVVEEVSLGKEVSEKEETIKDTVRHTEVDTENIRSTDSGLSNSTDTDYNSDKL